MKQPLRLRPRGILPAVVIIVAALLPPAFASWWEQPHDKWYLKDDWKAAAANRFASSFTLLSPATNGWIVIWGDQGVTLRVNGRPVMSHVDRGLIYDTNLTAFILGAGTVELQAGPGRIVAEGEVVDDQGRRYPFASGCNWPAPAPPGTPLPPAAKPYRPGAASGAFHSAHNGRLIRYNDEERGKADIAQGLARLQKLRDQSIFLLRRFRPAEEILSFSPETLWRHAEGHAAGLMAEAETLLRQQSIPAQKGWEFAGAIALAAQAGLRLEKAELAVAAARQLEQAERQLMHLEACAGLMSSSRNNLRGLGSAPGNSQSLPASAPVDGSLAEDFSKTRSGLTSARQAAATHDWGDVQRRVVAAQATLASLESRLSRHWGADVGRLDESPEDRFGWFNAQTLMGNDPAMWEFSTVNPAAHWIDLSGTWSFRTDPANQGETLGWHQPDAPDRGWRHLQVPGPWEREGVLEDNDHAPWDCPYKLSDFRCEDKPYNGYAWYRRDLLIPDSWAERTVVLRVGKVSNWLHVFLNGQAVADARPDGGSFSLPNRLLKPGQTNSLAIQVYNHDNFGGITGGPVALALDDAQPDRIVTPGPLTATVETITKLPQGAERTVAFASALSPAVIFASDQATVHLWGWEAKGKAPPRSLSFQTAQGEQTLLLDQLYAGLDGETLADSWLFLRGRDRQDDPAASRSVLLVLEKRPRQVLWGVNELGYGELSLAFGSAGKRVLVRMLSPDERWDAAACQGQSHQLRALPVACSELAQLDLEALRGSFRLQYHYFTLPDFTGQPARPVAPLPMLLSCGLQHGFPGLDVDEHVTTTYATEHATYRYRPDSVQLHYTTPLIDKSRLLKGVGELFAKRKPELNARGGNTEQQMFDDWQLWGFDHCRYAFAWGASWDIPLQKFVGGPISDDPELWARMDGLVTQHADHGLMAMLCYFFNEDSPQRGSKNLMRNSTRYWQMHPQVRTNCYELWRRIADRYKDRPATAVAYDFFNEPAYMHRDDWNRIIKDLTKIVRSVDPAHLIVCEAGDGWSQPQWFHWLEPTGDTNTIYSFHHYGKHWGYDRDEYYPSYSWPPEKENDILLEAVVFGIRHNVPLHCGEFGVSMISPATDHLVWLDDYLARFERFGIGWNWWNWSGTDIYRTGLKAGDEVSPNLAILRKWIARKESWR